jgi:MoaA/NifB/PqqE/SkfB family radical SAM enzyme
MPLKEFEKILDELVPKYGKPQINLEGSGEPTMAKDLFNYVKAVKKRDLKCFMYCNGARLNGEFMKKVIDAGIDFIRISVIGYNRQLYKKWMNIDNFDLILSNIQEIKNYIEVSNSKCLLSTYHLITDNSKIDYEINEYQNNVINLVNTQAYIWKMHNWSGNHDNINKRLPSERRSCGRPFAPELTVRAGGEKGRTGAVVPCCQTLGPPNEAKSILGHLDKESYKQILEGDRFKKLRKAHKEKNFDDIDYCKNCDFLFDDPEVLVWSNDPGAKVNHMLGTEKNFILTNYSNNN